MCDLCDPRCDHCVGPLMENCITCKYYELNGICKLCEEVDGLYFSNAIQKCQSLCGDTIIAGGE